MLFCEEIWIQLLQGIWFVLGEFDNLEFFQKLCDMIEKFDVECGMMGNYVFYLLILLKDFFLVVKQLKDFGFVGEDSDDDEWWWCVVIEKLFGYDFELVCVLNVVFEVVFFVDLIFCIDYYFGKEMVQNILVLWFVNELYELIWNCNYVDYVQIMMVEDIGVGGCVGYYDGIGVVCDVIQNYLLQLFVFIVMEELISLFVEYLCVEKEKVFVVVYVLDDLLVVMVCGQYVGGW